MRELDCGIVAVGIEIMPMRDMPAFIEAEQSVTCHAPPPDGFKGAAIPAVALRVCRPPDIMRRWMEAAQRSNPEVQGQKSFLGRYAYERSVALDGITTLERAFILAETGSCRTVSDIRTQLKKEQRDSVDAHLAGPTIQRQLKERLTAKLAD